MTQILPRNHNPEACADQRQCKHVNCIAYWAGYDAGYAETYGPAYAAALAQATESGSQP